MQFYGEIFAGNLIPTTSSHWTGYIVKQVDQLGNKHQKTGMRSPVWARGYSRDRSFLLDNRTTGLP